MSTPNTTKSTAVRRNITPSVPPPPPVYAYDLCGLNEREMLAVIAAIGSLRQQDYGSGESFYDKLLRAYGRGDHNERTDELHPLLRGITSANADRVTPEWSATP